MILVDTSVWIDHFRATDSAEALRLATALREGEDPCLCGVIVTEVLQGIRHSRQHAQVRRALAELIYLPMTFRAHVLAGDIYRAARARGRTIRNAVDCMIAACAIWHGVPLLQRDRDFRTIAEVSDLWVLAC